MDGLERLNQFIRVVNEVEGVAIARWWSEPLKPDKHLDFMSTCHIGGVPIEAPRDPLIKRFVFFIEVTGFTFQFATLEQVRIALAYFEQRIHPSSRLPDIVLEHYWQRWFERLPQWLSKESRRIRVVSALSRALQDFHLQDEV